MLRAALVLSVIALMLMFGPACAFLRAGETTATPVTAAPAIKAGAAAASAAELKGRLLELASHGKLTDGMIGLFKTYAGAVAHEKFDQEVPAKFWKWLDGDKANRDALLVALHPDYNVDIVRRLMALKEKFPDQVDDYRSLALAFAVVYGRAGDNVLKPQNFLMHPRPKFAMPAPTMEESFEYYMKNERSMRFPLKRTPWPLMVFLADNDLPLADRQWALAHYGNLDYAKFGKVYSEVNYDNSAIHDRVGKLAGQDYTLANILKSGGICGDQAYFASRIFKSLGVPSIFDTGVGEGAAHAWIGWMNPKGGEVDLAFSNRFDQGKFYTGTVWDPATRKPCLDRDVQMMLIAVQQSYSGYMDALIGSYIYRLCEGDARKPAVGLLKEAVKRNAYCAEPWRDLASATAEQIMPRPEGEQMFDDMFRLLAKYPDLTFESLSEVLKPRLEGTADTDPEAIKKNLQLLDAAFALYEKGQRPDLAVVLRLMQGKYLEKVGRSEDALKHYETCSEKYADQHYGVTDLFDSALKLMAGPDKDVARFKYLDQMANLVPEYPTEFNRQNHYINPVYSHVVVAYANALIAAGKTAEAAQWAAKIGAKLKSSGG